MRKQVKLPEAYEKLNLTRLEWKLLMKHWLRISKAPTALWPISDEGRWPPLHRGFRIILNKAGFLVHRTQNTLLSFKTHSKLTIAKTFVILHTLSMGPQWIIHEDWCEKHNQSCSTFQKQEKDSRYTSKKKKSFVPKVDEHS